MNTAGRIAHVDFYEQPCSFIHVVFFQPGEAHSAKTLQLSLTRPLLFCVKRGALLYQYVNACSSQTVIWGFHLDQGLFV